MRRYADHTLLIGLLKMHSYDDDNGLGGHKGMGHMRVNNLLPNNSTNQGAYWSSGISIDQHLGNVLGVEPLTLGARVKGRNGGNRMPYTGADQAVDPVEDPVTAFNQWFGDLEPGATNAEQLAAAQRSNKATARWPSILCSGSPTKSSSGSSTRSSRICSAPAYPKSPTSTTRWHRASSSRCRLPRQRAHPRPNRPSTSSHRA